jgi:hypothetical protein
LQVRGGLGAQGGLNVNDEAELYLREMPADTTDLFIALWRYKRSGSHRVNRLPGPALTLVKTRRRWVHPSHQNGAPLFGTGTNQDGGTHNDTLGNPLPGRDSEWALPAQPFFRINIGDMTEWMDSGTPVTFPGGGGVQRADGNQKGGGTNRFHRALFKFSLMRRTDPMGQREVGPLSSTLILSPTLTPDYLIPDDESIRYRMFIDSGRVF